MSTQLSENRFWARGLRVNGKQPSLGIYPTREEADAVERAFAMSIVEEPTVDNKTIAGFGESWLDDREVSGARGISTDRNRWKNHIASAQIASMRFDRVKREHVKDWIDDLYKKKTANKYGKKTPISNSTVSRCVSLLSACFGAAIEKGLCEENPIRKIKLRKHVEDDDPWTFLEPMEQQALLSCEKISMEERCIIGFALGTGMRQAEQRKLKLQDFYVGDNEREPRVVLRRTKNGKNRTIPIFGLALAAARKWVELLPAYCPKNPKQLVFPNAVGGMRSKGHMLGLIRISGKRDDRWKHCLELAGIKRNVRWHDLRHSCASSLICGWWGRRWTLEEVKPLLGHLTLVTTSRYAHLGESALKTAATITQGSELWRRTDSSDLAVGQQGIEPWTTGLKERCKPSTNSSTYDLSSLRRNAVDLLTAQASGDPSASRLATELASRILNIPLTVVKVG